MKCPYNETFNENSLACSLIDECGIKSIEEEQKKKYTSGYNYRKRMNVSEIYKIVSQSNFDHQRRIAAEVFPLPRNIMDPVLPNNVL